MRTVEKEQLLNFEEKMIIPKSEPILSASIALVDDIPGVPVERSTTVLGKVCSRYSLSDITEVTNCLLLCGAAAVHPDKLNDLGVTCVINATSELPNTPLPENMELIYLRVNVSDKTTEDLMRHFDSVSDIIEEARCKGGRTLIHCVAGVSRSATLCLAYLMKYCNMSLKNAFFYLRSKRPCVRPNSGFFSQLIEFERKTFGFTSVTMVYNEIVGSMIPDIYEPEYLNMAWYQQNFKRHCRRH